MTLTQMERRLAKLETLVDQLADRLDYQQTVAGVRAGLASADKRKGQPLDEAFKSIRARVVAKRTGAGV